MDDVSLLLRKKQSSGVVSIYCSLYLSFHSHTHNHSFSFLPLFIIVYHRIFSSLEFLSSHVQQGVQQSERLSL